MTIVKLWAVLYEDRKYYSTGAMTERDGSMSFGSNYYSNYRYMSLHSSEDEAVKHCGKKFLHSTKEVLAIDIGSHQFVVIGLVEKSMPLS